MAEKLGTGVLYHVARISSFARPGETCGELLLDEIPGWPCIHHRGRGSRAIPNVESVKLVQLRQCDLTHVKSTELFYVIEISMHQLCGSALEIPKIH
jgi:hypothetical protein